MAHRVLLTAAVVVSLVAVALVLVPFSARLDAVGRDGRPLEFSVVVECRAPILDAAGTGAGAAGALPAEACTDRARQRSAGGVGAGVVGAALLVAGLRSRPPQPNRS